MQLLGIAAALVVFRLLPPQQRFERGGARDQLLGRKVGLRNGQESWVLDGRGELRVCSYGRGRTRFLAVGLGPLLFTLRAEDSLVEER